GEHGGEDHVEGRLHGRWVAAAHQPVRDRGDDRLPGDGHVATQPRLHRVRGPARSPTLPRTALHRDLPVQGSTTCGRPTPRQTSLSPFLVASRCATGSSVIVSMPANCRGTTSKDATRIAELEKENR